jgi:O-antigen/teichoic acid export membrane protein
VTVLSDRLRQLVGQSAVYGLGGLISRILAVLLLPLYTAYLDPSDLGAVGVVTALNAVLVTILRGGISSAFFRFWFDSPEPERRRTVLRTSFWYTMAAATFGLVVGWAFAPQIADALSLEGDDWLVRAAFVGLWAQMNYEQLTAVFRVEQRAWGFLAASLANVAITIGATVVLVVFLDEGAIGVIVGNFTGTLAVYLALLAYRREQLGLELDRRLLAAMQRFGWPLVPSALALIAINFSDRFFIAHLASLEEVGRYELGVRIASAMVLLLSAFRMAWPGFAYSIEDEDEAKRTYAFVLTYLVALASWIALALGLLAPWLVQVLAPTNEAFWPGERVVAPLAFGAALFAGFIVVSIGIGRARRTGFNWIVTGTAAAVDIGLNLALVPTYGMEGAAAAALVSFAVLFAFMAAYSHRIYPVPYQWRRVLTALLAGGALAVAGKAVDVPLGGAIALALAYPLILLPLGFYLPAERARLRALVRA